MTRRLTSIVVLLSATLFVSATAKKSDPVDLTVHEWGTFTSIADAEGNAIHWQPLTGPQDLPCFVERVRYYPKEWLPGTVRMETPVLYFYAPEDTTVNVSVRFRQGLVTEWFPKAAVTPQLIGEREMRGGEWQSRIDWKNVSVLPRGASDFPTESGSSHYYAARVTDASPLLAGSQKEKFLFYRGVGRFPPPITARVGSDARIDVASRSGESIGDVILFENRGGKIGYQVVRAKSDRISISPSQSSHRELTALRRELERILVAQGLYPKEASAMVETWRDSWFEEGTRLFYIASRKTVDDILPLEVSPRPASIARVFVGRMELITPAAVQEIQQAIDEYAGATLVKYGRFLQPILDRILAEAPPAHRAATERRVNAAYQMHHSTRRTPALCR